MIGDIFIDRKAKKLGMPERYGAVCICLLGDKKDPSVLFEVRANNLSQPGDVCFPGGRQEEGEEPVETAIRECMEELCIEREQIHLLGPSDYFVTSAEFSCYPFVVWLSDYAGSFHKDEVKEIFTIPLKTLLEVRPDCYEVKSRIETPDDFPFDKIVGGRNYKWRERKTIQYFYDVEGRTIWGMTARMLKGFLDILREENLDRRKQSGS